MVKYRQMQLIVAPTAIEDLLNQDADYDLLADAMLLNWETFESLQRSDESWNILRELPDEFIFDDILNDHNAYKGIDYRSLIIKVRDRFFSYNYSTSIYDDECWDWQEVYPTPKLCYIVTYSKKQVPSTSILKPEYSDSFKKFVKWKKGMDA